MQPADDLLLLGRTDWRDRIRPFGVHPGDRMAHLYAVGQTGTGKTTLLQNLVWQDLKRGQSVEHEASSVLGYKVKTGVRGGVPGNGARSQAVAKTIVDALRRMKGR